MILTGSSGYAHQDWFTRAATDTRTFRRLCASEREPARSALQAPHG